MRSGEKKWKSEKKLQKVKENISAPFFATNPDKSGLINTKNIKY
jgi:hypothetical protein